MNYRITRTGTDGKKTKYAYGRNGAVIVERTGNSTRSYIYANGVIAGFVDTDGEISETRYCVTDHQGSVEKIVDGTGSVLWASCYTAFGMKGGETVNRIEFTGMFTGKDIDPETGLTYHWNRWRSEDGSVWLSEDPARDGTNWYGYCGNNPLIYTDRNGLWFGADDVITGPIDEILVLGGITLFSAIKIYNSDVNKKFSEALSEAFADNVNKVKEHFSKKDKEKKKEEPSSLPKDGVDSGKEGYVPPPDSLPGVPDAKPAKPKTPKQGAKSGKRKRWKDSDGNIYEWDYQHGDVEKYDKRGKHKGSIDPKSGEQTKPPVKGREVEP